MCIIALVGAVCRFTKHFIAALQAFYSWSFTGTLQAFLCGKLSYAFGFSGPSQVIDTACSSSIIAVYQACRALADRDCNAAIAGGVNVIASPDVSGT